ncbi:hypothetical protein PLICRDRAFT_172791 [Plicaturopsis crispa FD-325 SS-3]|nr:hypothetical protein PLICRDRAFT_172791 [Plicaturopsis crispa FD-325 SS-3]
MSSTGLRSFKVSEDGTSIEIVNQLLLPHTVEWIGIVTVEDCYDAIKSMKIRGAPAIASLASLFIAAYIIRALGASPRPPWLDSPAAFTSHLTPLIDHLYTARPTAVNLGAATQRLTASLSASVAAETDAQAVAEAVIKEARAINDEDLGRNKDMSKWGGEWLLDTVKKAGGAEEKLNVLTVCNTGSLATSGYGTALGLITYLHETGRLNKAYFTQSTPYHQGSRLTALELKTLGIPSVMICDTMVGSLFQHHKIHGVAVGADRITENGDTANKIGTYNAAVLAARHHIPFIVVAPVATVDLSLPTGESIPIEQRPPLEACLVRGALYPPTGENENKQAVVQLTPTGFGTSENLQVYNPSFDVTPADLIGAIVTEKGVAVKGEGKSSFELSTSAVV